MSFYVSLYAEYRMKGESKWNLVGTDAITDDFKLFIVGNPGDWTDSDRFNSFDPINPKTLSFGMLSHFPNADANPERFKALDIGIYESRLDDQIRDHRARIRTTLVALGMSANIDEYGELQTLDDWRIDDECSAKVRENRKASQLTFPVSKELLDDLVIEDSAYARALKNKGILEAIRGMISGYDEDNTEIRLIVVN